MKKLICGDNLDVLKSGAIDTASVDVVYLDPPFNSKSVYNLPFQKLGKDAAAVEAFTDTWHWDEETRDFEQRLKAQRDTIGLSTFIADVKDGKAWLRTLSDRSSSCRNGDGNGFFGAPRAGGVSCAFPAARDARD